MTNQKDQIIIQQVLKGNTNAFAELIDLYQDMVFGLAYKMTKNREEAEEVSQDSFVKAFKNLSSFKGDSKFSTWLYRIVYYTSLDAIKKNKKEQNTFEINEITFNQIESVDSILQRIERKERAQIIEQCLDKLPDVERALIWLFYFDELSLKEIVEITNMSEANVKVKLHRARKKLLTIVKENVEPALIASYGRK